MEIIFKTEVGKLVGTEAALVFSEIVRWVHANRSCGKNFHDGKYWTYNTHKSWVPYFENYFTERQIRLCLDKLKAAGLIELGKYNKSPTDHTRWYTLTELGWSLSGLESRYDTRCQIDMTPDVKSNRQQMSNQTNIVNYTTIEHKESKKNSACAHTREGVVADIIENNRAWVVNQIKAGIEPDDIPALLGYAYDYLVNTGDEPNSMAVVRCAFFKLRDFKERRRRERLRAIPYEERKNELWQQLRQLMPKYGKDLVTRFYAYQIKLKDGLMNSEQSPDFDPDAALTQWKLNDERNNKHAAL